jgi:tetratricopeptide (TPR) repeat protein
MDYKKTQHYLFGLLTGILLMPCTVQAIATDVPDVASVDQDKLLFAQAHELSVQQQWPAAESIYRDLLERNKEWPEPKNNLAILLLKTNRIDEARIMLEEAVVSSPSYRIAQKNRTQLYDFLAAQAYAKALGSEQAPALPEMDFIEHIYQQVKTVEKVVEKKVEVVVEKKVFIKSVPIQEESNVAVTRHIKEQLLNWSRAWSQGDFEHYIQSYSDRFVPIDERLVFSEWKNARRAKLGRGLNVQVTVDELKIFIDDSTNTALVEFVQYYTSPAYSDSVLKQLYMQKSQDNWQILSERVIKTL